MRKRVALMAVSAAMLLWPGAARAQVINCTGTDDFSAIHLALADGVTISLSGDCVAEVDESGEGQTLLIIDVNDVTIAGPATLTHPVVACDGSSPARNVLQIVNSRNIRLQELTIDGGSGVNVVDSTVRIQGGFTVQNSRGGGLNVSGAGGSDVSLNHGVVSVINSLSNNCRNGASVATGSRLTIVGDTLIEGNGRNGVNVDAGARANFSAFPINDVAQQITIQNNDFSA